MSGELDPRLVGVVDLLRRTGASAVELRYSEGEGDDPGPTVWLAIAAYRDERWEVGAGHNPLLAALRLAEQLLDGGLCTRCGRRTAFVAGERDGPEPVELLACTFHWQPTQGAYVRTCELAEAN